MAVTLGTFPITYKTVGMPRSAAGDKVIEQVAARAFSMVTERWPVDTGVSRGGLNYMLTRTRKGAVMTVRNRNNYARWVERIHYPLRRVLTDKLFARLAATSRMAAVDNEGKLARKLTNVTDPAKTSSRPVTVQRIGEVRKRPRVPLKRVNLFRLITRPRRPPTVRKVADRLIAGGAPKAPPVLLGELTEEAIRAYAAKNGLSRDNLLLLLSLLRMAEPGTGNIRGAVAGARRRAS